MVARRWVVGVAMCRGGDTRRSVANKARRWVLRISRIWVVTTFRRLVVSIHMRTGENASWWVLIVPKMWVLGIARKAGVGEGGYQQMDTHYSFIARMWVLSIALKGNFTLKVYSRV